MKFLIISEYAELLDLAMTLKSEGHEVLFNVPNKDYSKIGDGMVEKIDDAWPYMGKGYVWVFDGCSSGKRQDWLREKGEIVFGGSEQGDKLENDRQLGQKLFKAAGFQQPQSKNFKNFDEAITFVKENSDKRWIMKQNSGAPKSLNHLGKFDGGIDMVYHLESMKKRWNESAFGPVDFDLMEIVEGLECAASVLFNGKDFMKNKDGKIVAYLNFEEKKECDGQTGETTGETGTTFIGVTEDNKLFRDIIVRPKVLEALRASKFRGVFDINCIKTKEGIVALEATCRFGIPATSYEFCHAMKNVGETIKACADMKDYPVEIKQGIGMVMCLMAKPYPVEADMDEEATSIGEKLWILKSESPVDDFSEDQKKKIHLQNFYKDDDGNYIVATKNGYLLTVTDDGESIDKVRKNIIQYIKDNVYISGMKYRTDIGKRVEEYFGLTPEQKVAQKIKEKIESTKEDSYKKVKEKEMEVKNIKKAIRNALIS